MGINLLLKKEGLENIKRLSTLQINRIASDISNKLCQSFPELHLSQSNLFMQISRLEMYTAKMQDIFSSAKYVYGNNIIFFNESLDLNNMTIPVMHECIHYLQEFKDLKGKLLKLGLYDVNKDIGLALNEAAVQLMATRTEPQQERHTVTYFGLTFTPESSEFYPLECALLSQMAFFTGDEALYFSTLYGVPMFEKTFTNASTPNAFSEIQGDFDKLLNLETELAVLTTKLQTTDISFAKSKIIQSQIENTKKSITTTCIKIQNKIIENCFNKQFINANSFIELTELERNLKEFEKLLITHEHYYFYEQFCYKMSKNIKFKRDQLTQYGRIIDIPKGYSDYLPAETTIRKFSKVQEIISTLKEFIFGE